MSNAKKLNKKHWSLDIRRSIVKHMANKRGLGQLGEDIAKKYLQKCGYKIITANYRSRSGEIDLICKKADTLIFIEVKTRSNAAFGFPEEAITKQKQEHLAKAAEKFLLSYSKKFTSIQFDAVSIIAKDNSFQIKHFKNIIQDLDNS